MASLRSALIAGLLLLVSGVAQAQPIGGGGGGCPKTGCTFTGPVITNSNFTIGNDPRTTDSILNLRTNATHDEHIRFFFNNVNNWELLTLNQTTFQLSGFGNVVLSASNTSGPGSSGTTPIGSLTTGLGKPYFAGFGALNQGVPLAALPNGIIGNTQDYGSARDTQPTVPAGAFAASPIATTSGSATIVVTLANCCGTNKLIQTVNDTWVNITASAVGGVNPVGWHQVTAIDDANTFEVSNFYRFSGTISGTDLTVVTMFNGDGGLAANMILSGGTVTTNTKIVSQTSGTPGGAGVYVVDTSQTVSTLTAILARGNATSTTSGGGTVTVTPSFVTGVNKEYMVFTTGAGGFPVQEAKTTEYLPSFFGPPGSTMGALQSFNVVIGPPDTTGFNGFSLAASEIDVVSRSIDSGFTSNLSGLTNLTQGFQIGAINIPGVAVGGGTAQNVYAGWNCFAGSTTPAQATVALYQCLTSQGDSIVGRGFDPTGRGGDSVTLTGARTALGNPPFATTSGSPKVTVTQSGGHGVLANGTIVRFPSTYTIATITFGGPTNSYVIADSTPGGQTFTISPGGNASTDASGGGANQTMYYQSRVPNAPTSYHGEFAYGLTTGTSFISDTGSVIATQPGNGILWMDGTNASFTASIATTNMTVATVTAGTLTKGMHIVGAAPNTTIVSQTSGSAGSTGVYVVSVSQATPLSGLTGVSGASINATTVSAGVIDINLAAMGTGQIRATAPIALSDVGTTLITTSTTIPVTYQIALLDSTSGALSETIQACNSGSKWDQIFKDATGKAATNNVTLSPSAGTIDGAATFVMKTAWQAISLHSNGSTCYVY